MDANPSTLERSLTQPCDGVGGCGEVKPLEAFPKNGRDGYRRVCKACYSTRQVEARRALLESGRRKCDECKATLPLEAFAPYSREGSAQHRQTCMACEAAQGAAMDEWEAEMEACADQRGIIALNLVLEHAGLSLAEYRALRGPERATVERAWTLVMKELARAAGEWNPEWDDPKRLAAHIDAARAGGETKRAKREEREAA